MYDIRMKSLWDFRSSFLAPEKILENCFEVSMLTCQAWKTFGSKSKGREASQKKIVTSFLKLRYFHVLGDGWSCLLTFNICTLRLRGRQLASCAVARAKILCALPSKSKSDWKWINQGFRQAQRPSRTLDCCCVIPRTVREFFPSHRGNRAVRWKWARQRMICDRPFTKRSTSLPPSHCRDPWLCPAMTSDDQRWAAMTSDEQRGSAEGWRCVRYRVERRRRGDWFRFALP